MRIHEYDLTDLYIKTRYADFYLAQRCDEKEAGLVYLVKTYRDTETAKILAERERIISQEIMEKSESDIVLPILHNVWQDGKCYQIMLRKRQGIFLEKWISKMEEIYGVGKIPVPVFCRLGRMLLRTIAALHGSGYLHLDLHPGNIFLENTNIEKKQWGFCKLVDFTNGQRTGTRARIYGITEGYSAPELLDIAYDILRDGWHDEQQIGPGADLYSVAAILFRIMTGKNYTGMPDEIGRETKMYASCMKLPAFLSEEIALFFKMGLQETALYRFASAAEMKDRIVRIKTGEEKAAACDYKFIMKRSDELMIPPEKSGIEELPFHRDSFEKAAVQLSRDLLKSNVRYHECGSIFKGLWLVAQKHRKEIDNASYVSLACSGLACTNHIADGALGRELLTVIEENRTELSIQEYMSVCNRIVTVYIDRCEYEKALELSVMSIRALQLLLSSQKTAASIFSVQDYRPDEMTDLGRAYGCAGQSCAYLIAGADRHERAVYAKRAEEYFARALEVFGNDPANRDITLSHLVHLAAEKAAVHLMEKPGEYLPYAMEYFKPLSNDPFVIADTFFRLSQDDQIDLFRVYAYLKWIYYFMPDQIKQDEKEELNHFLHNPALLAERRQPVDRIYRYGGLILQKAGADAEMVEHAFWHATCNVKEALPEPGKEMNILIAMNYQTIALYNSLLGHEEENKHLHKKMETECRKYLQGSIEKMLSRRPLSCLFSFEQS